MKKHNILSIITIFVFITMLSLVSANYPIAVMPLDGSGDLQISKTFSYTFNFTTAYNCSGVVLSYSENITTNKNGLYVMDINTNTITGTPSFICEYRNGTLRTVHNISNSFSNVSRANYFIGNGSLLTGLVKPNGVETLLNKTLTFPKINEDVFLTANSTALNFVVGVTSSIQTQLNSKLTDLVSDLTPQLGGNLDAQGFNVTAIDCLIFESGGKICTG